jgi:hypothetical protein
VVFGDIRTSTQIIKCFQENRLEIISLSDGIGGIFNNKKRAVDAVTCNLITNDEFSGRDRT